MDPSLASSLSALVIRSELAEARRRNRLKTACLPSSCLIPFSLPYQPHSYCNCTCRNGKEKQTARRNEKKKRNDMQVPRGDMGENDDRRIRNVTETRKREGKRLKNE